MMYLEDTICSDPVHPLDPVLVCDHVPWTFKWGGGGVCVRDIVLLFRADQSAITFPFHIFTGLNHLKHFQKIEE